MWTCASKRRARLWTSAPADFLPEKNPGCVPGLAPAAAAFAFGTNPRLVVKSAPQATGKAIAGTSTGRPACSEREKTVRVPRQGFRKTLRCAPTERPQGPLRRTARHRYRPPESRNAVAGEHGWNREETRPRNGASFIFLASIPRPLPPLPADPSLRSGQAPGEGEGVQGKGVRRRYSCR